jgi:predicted GNAT superfamily acetyltransferase
LAPLFGSHTPAAPENTCPRPVEETNARPKIIYGRFSLSFRIQILETPVELAGVEALQRQVWPGNETEVVPAHLLIAAIHNGGFLLGALSDSQPDRLLGFVFGFPGLYFTPDGPRPMHCSHMLGVLPEARGRGVGFALKRAQWQMVRHQGLDRINWTFDPLLSRNAHLNIARLGGVCSTYLRDLYGELRDDLNAGLPTDRFLVDWWVNSQRVNRRLSKSARTRLDLAHFLAAGAEIANPTRSRPDGFPEPAAAHLPGRSADGETGEQETPAALLLIEIPADFQALKAADPGLAHAWRQHSRELFEALFTRGYLVTDFVYLAGAAGRSFYVLSHGESTL